MYYFCCNAARRIEVAKDTSGLNGIDFLEVVDTDAPSDALRQRILEVHFLKPIDAGVGIGPDKVRIDGGERIRDIGVESAEIDALNPEVLVVTVDQRGDFSRYVLRIVADADAEPVHPPNPPDGIDPMLSVVDFSFKIECPSDFDCNVETECPEPSRLKPAIDYLAKDYDSFRRLMLDRMALIIPAWTERNAADLGITLVELMAFVGDHLSYRQDAVATEAYLETARRRVSVRRHARLIDYSIDEGRNARTWVHFHVEADILTVGVVPAIAAGTPLLTKLAGIEDAVVDDADLIDDADAVFEIAHDVVALRVDHNEMSFYTWSDSECCLPRGAVQATLEGNYPNLSRGDVLVFEEIVGPGTGKEDDADATRRHVVRLVGVEFERDGSALADPLTNTPITQIAWHAEDALPFPFCLSAVTSGVEKTSVEVSVARGNMVLADHGCTVSDEDLGTVPEAHLEAAMPETEHCLSTTATMIPRRYRPRLGNGPLTHAPFGPLTWAPAEEPNDPVYDPTDPSRSAAATIDPDEIPVPAIRLGDPAVSLDERPWRPRRDLLGCSGSDPHFVAEIERDGTAYIRFGDGTHGDRPEPGTPFVATYRIGNGTAGNIGADALSHVFEGPSDITEVRNPLPAAGGRDAETIEEVRQRAPTAFRTQERAVTADDYAAVTERHDEVQRAVASFRWTGSWRTVFVTVDREGGAPIDEDFETELRAHLERYRMAGYDVEIDAPAFIPIEVEMKVCVASDYARSAVKDAVFDVLSNRERPDGSQGLFHADRLTFGQTFYLSPIQAAAQAIAGVESVTVTTFRRQGDEQSTALDDGFIALERLEIARLDNDPSFPERGVLKLEMGGGR